MNCKRKRVLLDGFNLVLEKGTGVATYARNLSYGLKKLGYAVDVLYGQPAYNTNDQLLREIAFFDPPKVKAQHVRSVVRAIAHPLRSPSLKLSSNEIIISGNVVTDDFRNKLPAYDRIFNGNRLFRQAEKTFQVWNRMSSVSVATDIDYAHWTYPLPVYQPGVKNIYTIHDLVPLRLPYTTLDYKKTYYRLIEQILKRAHLIVTVSENSKNDIVNLFGYPEDRIINTYQSAGTVETAKNDLDEMVVRDEIFNIYGLGYKNYYIFFGSIEPKKNVARIVEAYLASNAKRPLVIIGAQAWKAEQELKLYDNLKETGRLDLRVPTSGDNSTSNGTNSDPSDSSIHRKDFQLQNAIDKKIILLNYVPFTSLVQIIAGARATLFPSLYEGFGLPVLESMLLGTPVLSSKVSSVPEIAGDAALLVNPYSILEIKEGIRALDANDDLCESFSRKGLQRAAKFSQEEYEKRLNSVYRGGLGNLNR